MGSRSSATRLRWSCNRDAVERTLLSSSGAIPLVAALCEPPSGHQSELFLHASIYNAELNKYSALVSARGCVGIAASVTALVAASVTRLMLLVVAVTRVMMMIVEAMADASWRQLFYK